MTPAPDTAAMVERLRELDAKATPGPWILRGKGCSVWPIPWATQPACRAGSHPNNRNDAALIAEMRTALPDLLATTTRLTAELDAMREGVAKARKDTFTEAANYLDCYAGGHYMAQSCAAALRAIRDGDR